MTKILLSGCGGHMGQVVAHCAAERSDCEIAAGIDPRSPISVPFPVFSDPMDCNIPFDVIVDFSHPSALSRLLNFAIAKNTPAVIATTGLSQEQISLIQDASEKIPVFFTANMSLGVNLLTELARRAAAVLSDTFDIEILEKHHNKKIDAPSGTALMLADEINDQLDHSKHYIYDRHTQRKKREKTEIGIHSVRGGTIVGEHDVIFAGHDEIITLRHTAMSKEVFATGAINAALYVAKQVPGLYSMKELLQHIS